jgi:hypothetical protein
MLSGVFDDALSSVIARLKAAHYVGQLIFRLDCDVTAVRTPPQAGMAACLNGANAFCRFFDS